eukprot:scaffold295942_cov15-Tisochrysis_lutea.AAC.1
MLFTLQALSLVKEPVHGLGPVDEEGDERSTFDQVSALLEEPSRRLGPFHADGDDELSAVRR